MAGALRRERGAAPEGGLQVRRRRCCLGRKGEVLPEGSGGFGKRAARWAGLPYIRAARGRWRAVGLGVPACAAAEPVLVLQSRRGEVSCRGACGIHGWWAAQRAAPGAPEAAGPGAADNPVGPACDLPAPPPRPSPAVGDECGPRGSGVVRDGEGRGLRPRRGGPRAGWVGCLKSGGRAAGRAGRVAAPGPGMRSSCQPKALRPGPETRRARQATAPRVPRQMPEETRPRDQPMEEEEVETFAFQRSLPS